MSLNPPRFKNGPPSVPPQSSPLSVLITGASRGIGLELVKQYTTAHPQNKVFAAIRDPHSNRATEIQQLAKNHPSQITIIELDVSQSDSILHSVKQVSSSISYLNLLINNAGILSAGIQKVGETTRDNILTDFTTNLLGPFSVIQAYIGLLEAGTRISGKESTVINISSLIGSNQWTTTSPVIATSYGISKAALNYLTSILKNSYPQINFLVIHPGTVDTEMARKVIPNAPVTPADSAQGIRYVAATKGIQQSGQFINIVTNELIPY